EGASRESVRRRDAMLKEVWARVRLRDRFGMTRRFENCLADPAYKDPWLRSVLWSEYREQLHYTGRLEDRHIEALLQERLPTAEPYRETALREGRRRPALGIRLMERAAAIDSRLPFTPELRAPLEYFLARQA